MGTQGEGLEATHAGDVGRRECEGGSSVGTVNPGLRGRQEQERFPHACGCRNSKVSAITILQLQRTWGARQRRKTYGADLPGE